MLVTAWRRINKKYLMVNVVLHLINVHVFLGEEGSFPKKNNKYSCSLV